MLFALDVYVHMTYGERERHGQVPIRTLAAATPRYETFNVRSSIVEPVDARGVQAGPLSPWRACSVGLCPVHHPHASGDQQQGSTTVLVRAAASAGSWIT